MIFAGPPQVISKIESPHVINVFVVAVSQAHRISRRINKERGNRRPAGRMFAVGFQLSRNPVRGQCFRFRLHSAVSKVCSFDYF